MPVAQKFAANEHYPLKTKHFYYLFYNGVCAVLKKDHDYLREGLPLLMKMKSPLWIKAMSRCLVGIAEESPEMVKEGLQQVVKTNGRREADPLAKKIGLELHGLYELCRWVSPDLVAGFDVEQSFPWDAGYYQWVRSHENPTDEIDLEKISPILHGWITTLTKPAWCQPAVAE